MDAGDAWDAIRSNDVLIALAKMTDVPLFLVGGAVRDLLRGARTVHDWDIIVPRDALALARRLADLTGGSYVHLHEDHPTARVVKDGTAYDLIAYRAEGLDADLHARDLTINAIAIDLRALLARSGTAVVDSCGGVADLGAGLLRPCSPEAFRVDPLRAVRLYRFVATLGFTPTSDAEMRAHEAASLLTRIAPERIAEELGRLFAAHSAGPAIHGLVGSGLWDVIAPEAAATRGMAQSTNHHLDVFDHNAAAAIATAEFLRTADDWARPYVGEFRAWLDTPVAGERTRRWLVPFAALMHDIGKPAVRQQLPDGAPHFPRHEYAGEPIARAIARRLRLGRHEMSLLGAFVRHHGRPVDLRKYPEGHTLRLMALLRDAAPGVILVALGDRATARGPNRPPEKVAGDIAFLQGLMHAYFGRYAPLLATPPLVRGEDLIVSLGMWPGKHIGYLLLRLRWRQLAGEITTPEAAIRVARALVESGENTEDIYIS
jgi:poly(A) polymerase